MRSQCLGFRVIYSVMNMLQSWSMLGIRIVKKQIANTVLNDMEAGIIRRPYTLNPYIP